MIAKECSGDFTDIGAAHCYSRDGKLMYLFDYRVTDEMIASAEKKQDVCRICCVCAAGEG